MMEYESSNLGRLEKLASSINALTGACPSSIVHLCKVAVDTNVPIDWPTRMIWDGFKLTCDKKLAGDLFLSAKSVGLPQSAESIDNPSSMTPSSLGVPVLIPNPL